MNTRIEWRETVRRGRLGAAAALAFGLSAMAPRPTWATGFLLDTFESYTAVPTNVAQIGNGWDATGACTVEAGAGYANSQGMRIGADAKAWNKVTTNAAPNWIWTDLWMSQPSFSTPEALPSVLTNTAFMVALVTNTDAIHGCLYVVNPATKGWEACTVNATNGLAPSFTTGSWARISVFQNYASHQVTIFLNGVPMRTNWAFLDAGLSSYSNLVCEGASEGNVFLDNVSVSNGVPSGLTGDINGNKMPDGLELTTYGSLNVWTGSTISATVSNPAGGTLSPSGAVTGILYGDSTNFSFAANAGYVLDKVWTNGVLAVDYGSQGKTGAFNWTGITADGTFQVAFHYDGIRYVPGDYPTLAGAVAASLAGDTIMVSNGAYTGSVTVDRTLTFVGTNLTGLATFTVQSGVTNTLRGFTNFAATNLTLASNGVMIVSNAVLNLAALAIGENAFLYCSNGTVNVGGITFTGTFTLDQGWDLVLAAKPLNFNDTFEGYVLGTRLDRLGPNGWSAGATNAMVVDNPQVSSVNGSAQVAVAPAGSAVSNVVLGAGISNVWVDLMFRETEAVDWPDSIDTNGPVVCFIDTNGWLTVLTPGGWDVCSNDAWNAASPNVATGQWAQVTWFMDYEKQTAAYFLNGHLLRQQLPFAHPAARVGGVKLMAGDSTGWLDSVNIQTNLPSAVTNNWPSAIDLDRDGLADAVEIERYGSTMAFPRGSVYMFR